MAGRPGPIPGGYATPSRASSRRCTHGDCGPDGVDARSWPWRSAVRIRSVTLGTSVLSQQEGTATLTVSYAVRSWFDSRCCDHAGAARVAERLPRNQESESSTLSTGPSALAISSLSGSACCAGRGSSTVNGKVAGSSPVARILSGVAQRKVMWGSRAPPERPVLQWKPSVDVYAQVHT
jgi:hypothetical protein